MARAPQKTTRVTDRPMGAPPALAPRAPSRAKPINADPATHSARPVMGAIAATTRGRAAPAEKVTAEVIAAWMGRAAVISDMPSSSRAWAPRASWAIICFATVVARSGVTPRAAYIPASSRTSASWSPASSDVSRARSAFSVSDWELTETYSPAAIDMAPAARPATPAIRTAP
ncbi:hypothetical protein D3C72_398940 [compost metagenome]